MNANVSHGCSRKPKGVVALELCLVIPIAMIFVLGIVKFGLVLSGSSQLMQASEVGAQAASLQLRGSASSLLPAVTSAVDTQLTAASFSTSPIDRQIIVEETTAGGSTASVGAALFSPPDPLNIPADSVRVTVAVRLTELSADFLQSYGFSISGGYAYFRSTRIYNGSAP